MKHFLIIIAAMSLLVAGCGRGEEPAPSAGVESGNLPPSATDQEEALDTPPSDPPSPAPDAEQPSASTAEEEKPLTREGASSSNRPGVKNEEPKQPSSTALDAVLVAKGKTTFGEVGCKNCHSIGGEGGKIGPDLAHVGAEHTDVQFYLDLFADPAKMGKKNMPSFAHLPAEDLRALAEYMRSLR